MSSTTSDDLRKSVARMKVNRPDGAVRVITSPGALSNMQALADSLGVTIKVSNDVPPDALYIMDVADAERIPFAYAIEPKDTQA